MKVKSNFRCIALFGLPLIFMAGCSQSTKPTPEPSLKAPQIFTETNTLICGCNAASRVLVSNPNNVDLDVKWSVRFKNTDGGTDPEILEQEILIPGNQAIGIGCTRGDVDPNGTNSQLNCGYVYDRHYIKQYGKATILMGADETRVIPLFSDRGESLRLDLCAKSCPDGENCLSFNTGAKNLFIPLYDLYTAATDNDRNNIAYETILSKYGMKEADADCKRGPTHLLADGLFQNKATNGEVCEISLFEAAFFRHKLKLVEAMQFANMHLSIPTALEGKVLSNQSLGKSLTKVVRFSTDQEAPSIFFTGDMSWLNDSMGGTIQVMGERNIQREKGPEARFIAVTQTGGCLSFPTPLSE